MLLRWQFGREQTPELPPVLPPCFFHLLCQVSVVYELGLGMMLLTAAEANPKDVLSRGRGLVLALHVPAVPGKLGTVDCLLAFL